MDLTCLSIYPPLPLIPKTANDSNTFVHPIYDPSSGGLSQIISASIIRATFSTNDIHSLLNQLFGKDAKSWNISEITKIHPIPSIIIYSSIALALFLTFSLIFCIASCRNSSKYQGKKRRQSRTTQICVCLLTIIYLIGIGDMIYVAYRINKSRLSIDDTIKEINRDVYPREISEHMEYLNKQFFRLDQYCVDPNSILFNASKSMLVKAFDDVLKEKYFVQNIVQTMNNIDQHIRELSDEIDRHPEIPSPAVELFNEFQDRHQSMIDNLEIPLKEICNYSNGTQTDTDKILLEALEIVHLELKKGIDTINKDILSKITPWQDKMLLKTDFEEQIRGYISLGGTIIIVLVFVLGGIPLVFFIFILISRLCGCARNESNEDDIDRIPMANVLIASDTSSIQDYPNSNNRYQRNKVSPVDIHRQQNRSKKVNSNNGPSGVVLCLMRIAFVVMIILLVVLVLLTGIYYTLDLTVQGTCRTVHDDQPFLINFITGKLIESNIIFGNSSVMNTTMTNVIQDCLDQVHFSRKLIGNYWSILDSGVKEMMNILSQQILDQFIKSIGEIDIPSDINLLNQFVILANVPNISVIVRAIDADLIILQGYFEKINSTNATLPQSLVQTTVDEFKNYVKSVLELTIDACPLPLATVYKTDTLVCHTFGGSISGLWLSVFFFLSLITVGLCIFGVCVYKRLN